MRGVVPDKILNRYDKMGFVTSENTWIINNSSMFRNELLKSVDKFSNFIDGKQIIDRWDNDVSQGNIGVGSFYWRLVSAGIWFDKFKLSK